MRHWVWRVLLTAAAVAALTVGVMAAEGNEVTLDNGLVIKEITGSKWEVQGFAPDWTGSRDPLIIPASYGAVNANNITQIAIEAFRGDDDITTVIIPTSITLIGESAFDACPKLKTVVFLERKTTDPTLTIGVKAFSGCDNLSNLRLSRGVDCIKSQAFGANSALTEVVIPDGITKIEERAFAQCGNLKTVYIPDSLKPGSASSEKPIAASTFSGTALETIHYGCAVGDKQSIKEILDLPTYMTLAQVHRASNDRMITNPTCEKEGHVYGGFSCLEAPDTQTDVCKSSTGKTIDLPGGHDYQQTPASKAAYEAALAEHESEPCLEHEYTYSATCYRCGDEITETTKTIPADLTRHSWGEKQFDEESKVPATCKAPGSISWTMTCLVCGAEETGQDKVELDDPEDHTYTLGNTRPDKTIEATCFSLGVEVTRALCDCGTVVWPCETCDDLLQAIENSKNEPEETPEDEDMEGDEEGEAPSKETAQERLAKAIQAYVDHLQTDHNEDDHVSFTVLDITDHTWKEEYKETTAPTCTKDGVKTKTKTCTICGEVEQDPDDTEPIDKLGHLWDKEDPSYTEELIKDPTCTEDGLMRTTGKCLREDCDGEADEDGILTVEEVIPARHTWKDIDDSYVHPDDREATCTEPGQKTTGTRICEVCGEIDEKHVDILPALGHLWGDFKAANGEPITQEDNCIEVEGTATCMREDCGEESELRTLTIPGKLGHSWGEWEITKEPTATTPGSRTRTCTVCKDVVETEEIAATGITDPSEPDDPGTEDPGTSTDPSTPDSTSYRVEVISASNGSIRASRSTAKAGDRVTLTISANSGYEVDMVRVTTNTSVVNTTNLGGGEYRFTMPAANVEVRASFTRKAASSSNWTGSSSNSSSQSSSTTAQTVIQSVPKASASGQLFSDIPVSHWAAGEINWANQMGYMNGTSSGSFNPDGNITFQQMWMVMARLTGSNPSSMADARRWAVNGGFADGSAPNGSVTRQQLVTALYRCAHLMGTTNRNTTTLAGFPDSRTVPSVAREPFAWAVANGIIGGNSNGRLDPNGTLTRAQFAVILYRFSQRV